MLGGLKLNILWIYRCLHGYYILFMITICCVAPTSKWDDVSNVSPMSNKSFDRVSEEFEPPWFILTARLLSTSIPAIFIRLYTKPEESITEANLIDKFYRETAPNYGTSDAFIFGDLNLSYSYTKHKKLNSLVDLGHYPVQTTTNYLKIMSVYLAKHEERKCAKDSIFAKAELVYEDDFSYLQEIKSANLAQMLTSLDPIKLITYFEFTEVGCEFNFSRNFITKRISRILCGRPFDSNDTTEDSSS